MFGRSGPRAVVDRAISDALAGHGRLLLVTGEAGVGKTLLGQVAIEAAAEQGLRTAPGYAVDDAGAPVLWAWRRVARHLPELEAVLSTVVAPEVDDDAARWGVCEAAATALIGAGQPAALLVLLEDLHWADSLSVAVLRHLTFDLGSSRVLVVATARDEPMTAFGRTMPDLLRSPATVPLPLTGLDVNAVTDWLSADEKTARWLPLAADLVTRTNGNPFYIRRLTSEGPLPGPGSLDRLIAERSGLRGVLVAPFLRLPEETRRTLTTAALLAERLSPTLLAAATGKPVPEVADDIAVGIRAGVLLHGPTGLSFVHALVRDAVVAHTTADERARADAAIATAMEETRDDLLIGPSAVHWDRAGGTAASVRCRDRARLAAARAATARAHEEAVHFARMSLRHARALGATTEDLAERLIELARYEWLANLVADALASCVEAVDLAEECGRGDLMAQAALVPQGIGSIDVSRVVDGLCRRALELLPAEDLEARAGLLSQRAVAAAEEAADSSADGLSAAALDLARQSRSTHAELEAIAARHFVLSYPQTIDQRIPLAKRAVELGRTSTTAMGALWGHLWQAEIALQLGDLAGMDTQIADIGRTARHRSSPVGRWHELRLLAMRGAMLGSFDEARAHAQDSLGIAERVGDSSMVGMHFAFRQQLAYIRGDPDEVPDVMDALAHAPPIPLVQVSLALAQCLTGQLEAAASTFESLRGMPDRMPLGPRWAATVSQIAVVAVLLDDAEVAERCYRLLAPNAHWYGADGGGAPFSHGSNEYPLGLLARAYGDISLASGHFERAVEADVRLGARPYVALARLGQAQCLAQEPGLAGPVPARELADAAAAEFRRLDMPGPLAQAERLLAALPNPAASRHGLTPRELEVARLVGQALTNQQIADRLFLSVRTVESHVRGGLTKLHLTTRTELALWIRGQAGG